MGTVLVRRWTRHDYDRMVAAGVFHPGERLELIDGEVLAMTPLHGGGARLGAAYPPGGCGAGTPPLSPQPGVPRGTPGGRWQTLDPMRYNSPWRHCP